MGWECTHLLKQWIQIDDDLIVGDLAIAQLEEADGITLERPTGRRWLFGFQGGVRVSRRVQLGRPA
jgi:hypothetical protein